MELHKSAASNEYKGPGWSFRLSGDIYAIVKTGIFILGKPGD
ncbi:hypothetical protein [Peribacillus sp. SCS-155]